ncbi:hypothetical protein [Undibacterium parvum]|uniref:Uncharacterized protein n=1 Tax=Undibacterium parvum TaxID=401471 RepID=A0A3Q9BQP2_9BURK|nr:hypothetical protein [Undibacterium parvum]AZP12263.1 hypothetical protein EJN92_09785 [Undibacterium parvum]
MTAEQRKAQINQLKADKAKLDKAMGQKTAAKPAVKSEAKPTAKLDNKPAESQAKDVAPAAAAATPPNAATQQ